MLRSFALDDNLARFIDAQVECGRYNNASEVVRHALRLLEDQETLPEHERTDLARLAEEGLASGLSDEDGHAFLDRLEARYRRMTGAAST